MSVTVYGKITIFHKKINDLYKHSNSILDKKNAVLDYCHYVDRLILTSAITKNEKKQKKHNIQRIETLLNESEKNLRKKINEVIDLYDNNKIHIIPYDNQMYEKIGVINRATLNKPYTYDIIWNHSLIWRLYSLISETQYLLLLLYNLKSLNIIDGSFLRKNFRNDLIIHIKKVVYNTII